MGLTNEKKLKIDGSTVKRPAEFMDLMSKKLNFHPVQIIGTCHGYSDGVTMFTVMDFMVVLPANTKGLGSKLHNLTLFTPAS